MNPTSKYRIGLRYGLITGVLYAVLLFARYKFFASGPVSFGIFALVSYVIILIMYLLTGIARKKELGGYGEFKEIFQSIFIVILIAEAVYILFNFIYLKFIDPAFWENFKTTTLSYLQKQSLTDEQINEQMKGFKDADKNSRPLGLLKGFGYSVIIDCVFGVIFASILRKRRPVIAEKAADPVLPQEPKT